MIPTFSLFGTYSILNNTFVKYLERFLLQTFPVLIALSPPSHWSGLSSRELRAANALFGFWEHGECRCGVEEKIKGLARFFSSCDLHPDHIDNQSIDMFQIHRREFVFFWFILIDIAAFEKMLVFESLGSSSSFSYLIIHLKSVQECRTCLTVWLGLCPVGILWTAVPAPVVLPGCLSSLSKSISWPEYILHFICLSHKHRYNIYSWKHWDNKFWIRLDIIITIKLKKKH